jgi:hypothetical protein
VQEVIADAEAARAAAALTIEISAQEATTARDSATLRVKDVEDQAAGWRERR